MPIVNDLENIPLLHGKSEGMTVIVPKGPRSTTFALDKNGALFAIKRRGSYFDLFADGYVEDRANVSRLLHIRMTALKAMQDAREEKRDAERRAYDLDTMTAEAQRLGYFLTKKDAST